MAIVIAILIGVTAGVISAVKKDTAWDYAANVFALWGLSTPNFWLGILLIMLFAVQLGWLPASGYVSPFEDLKGNLAAMIMPAFVLGNSFAAVLMRHTRSAMLQVVSADYVRKARAAASHEQARRDGGTVHRALLHPRRALRALDCAVRSARDELERGAQGAQPRLSLRHRRDRARRPVARHLGHARLASRRRGLGVDLARARRADRPARRLRRRLDRWRPLQDYGCDARLPIPDPRYRARRLPRPEPHQRHDRHRHLGDADLHPPHARAGARRESGGLRRSGARARQPAPEDRAAPYPAQDRRAAHRPGHARDRRRGHRRGEPVLPRPGPAAARAELGQHAQHRQELSRPGAVDVDLAGPVDLPAGPVVQSSG